MIKALCEGVIELSIKQLSTPTLICFKKSGILNINDRYELQAILLAAQLREDRLMDRKHSTPHSAGF